DVRQRLPAVARLVEPFVAEEDADPAHLGRREAGGPEVAGDDRGPLPARPAVRRPPDFAGAVDGPAVGGVDEEHVLAPVRVVRRGVEEGPLRGPLSTNE